LRATISTYAQLASFSTFLDPSVRGGWTTPRPPLDGRGLAGSVGSSNHSSSHQSRRTRYSHPDSASLSCSAN
jgi:hypothetical protein